jgi:hypothetical protein
MSSLEIALLGVLGVAALSLIAGTAFVVSGRRRQAAAAAAHRERRAHQRARASMGEDPIVAALGVGGDAEGRSTRRARP